MFAIHKHSNPSAWPAFNVLGQVGTIACIVLIIFGHKIFGPQLVTLFVPLAMLVNAFVYLLWFLSSKTTAPVIPAVFWSSFSVLTFAAGFPLWNP